MKKTAQKILSCKRGRQKLVIYDSQLKEHLWNETVTYHEWCKKRGIDTPPQICSFESNTEPDIRKIVDFTHEMNKKVIKGRETIVFYDRKYKEWEKRIRAKAELKLHNVTLEKNPLLYALYKFQVYQPYDRETWKLKKII